MKIAVGRERSLDCTFGFGGLGYVGCDELAVQAFSRCRAGRRLGIGDDQTGPLLVEALGDAGADAARAPDDERDLACETSAHAILCRIWSLTVSSKTAASTRPPRIIWV